MAQLEPYKGRFEGKGASLVYVAAEKRGGIFKPEEFLRAHPVSYPFLLDEDRVVAKAWGVYHRLALDAYNIARPATFVVSSDSIVRFAFVGGNQHDRSSVEQVLAYLP